MRRPDFIRAALMYLSEKQRRIISSVQLQAHASVAQIAEETGYRPHVVRYALDFLRSRKILVPYICVDLKRLGLDDHCAYFSYLCATEAERQKLLSFLLQAPQVSVVSELAGEYQYNAAPYVRGLDEVDRLFSQITELCRGEFSAKSVATRVKWALFRPKYLSAHAAAVGSLRFGGEAAKTNPVTLVGTDHGILWSLAQAPLPSGQEIARRLGLAASSVESRIKRMEQRGVICGYAYALNTAACGIYTFRLLITQKHSSDRFCDELFQFAENHPNITSFVHCVGNWDYEVGIRSERAEEVPAIVQDIYSRYRQQITCLKLLTIVRRLKFSLYPFAKDGIPASSPPGSVRQSRSLSPK